MNTQKRPVQQSSWFGQSHLCVSMLQHIEELQFSVVSPQQSLELVQSGSSGALEGMQHLSLLEQSIASLHSALNEHVEPRTPVPAVQTPPEQLPEAHSPAEVHVAPFESRQAPVELQPPLQQSSFAVQGPALSPIQQSPLEHSPEQHSEPEVSFGAQFAPTPRQEVQFPSPCKPQQTSEPELLKPQGPIQQSAEPEQVKPYWAWPELFWQQTQSELAPPG